eukprot:10458400-Alexandrium_andersonii.AAC.1
MCIRDSYDVPAELALPQLRKVQEVDVSAGERVQELVVESGSSRTGRGRSPGHRPPRPRHGLGRRRGSADTLGP